MNYNDPESVPPVWEAGDIILNKYEVRQVFKGGGMGLVYRAYHREWDMELAIKSPRIEFFKTKQQIENFEREAETWVHLGLHPHTVSCYYVRRLGGIPRIFTEFVDGGTLADWIRSRKLYEGGPRKAMERILDIAIQLAWGLHYAHEERLVHQDVKPGNVMVNTSGNVKVTDFGLAKAKSHAGTPLKFTGERSILVSSGGMTPLYCSPEQAYGTPLSRKTDIWSWAITVFEMFVGEPPCRYGGQLAREVFDAFLDTDFEDASLPEIPEVLAEVLQRCFARDPSERPGTLLEVADTLEAVYQCTFSKTFPRRQPEKAAQSADALNNYAVSLLDLGCLFYAKNGTSNGAYDQFINLEEMDRTHVDGMFNRILMNWRHLSKPIHAISQSVDNALAIPGVANQVGLDWLLSLELETFQFKRATNICLRFRSISDVHRNRVAQIYTDVKNRLKGFFYGLTTHFYDSTATILDLKVDSDVGIAVSGSRAGLLCCFDKGHAENGTLNSLLIWRVSDRQEVFRLNNNKYEIRAAALSESGTALVVMFIEKQKDFVSDTRETSYRLCIYHFANGQENTIPGSIEITRGFIYLTVNDEGTAASVWVNGNTFGDWYQIEYNYNSSSKEFICKYDFRRKAPVIDIGFICSSGDGKRLLVASKSNIQLWETSGTYLKKCILEFDLRT